MTPRLVDELVAYLATRDEARPGDPAFPTRTGSRRDKDNIRNRVVAPAVKRANLEREAAGLPAIGVAVTPHTLRRTYISLLLSAGAEVPYVQAQVGHSDPKVTLEIYANVLKRRDRRRFGDAFDALMRDAIPSMQQAKMHEPRLANVGQRRLAAAPDRRVVRRIWAHNWAGRTAHDVPMHETHTAQNEERPANAGLPSDGRGGFRTCDLSRVKRALSH